MRGSFAGMVVQEKDLPLPKQNSSEYGQELAYRLACEQLSHLADIEQQCFHSGAQYQMSGSSRSILIKYLNRLYQITLPDIGLSLVDSEEEVKMRDKLLILHYFISAKGTPTANKPITFKELLGGNVYFPTFTKRTIKPLLAHLGNEPNFLVEAAQKLGGYRADYGDVAITIDAFSRLPITIVLWRGDDEFPPEGNIMFDSTISDYLDTEDIAVLCETMTWRLIKG